MTCQHLPQGASLEPRASFVEVPMKGGEEQAVMLQCNVAALSPVLGEVPHRGDGLLDNGTGSGLNLGRRTEH